MGLHKHASAFGPHDNGTDADKEEEASKTPPEPVKIRLAGRYVAKVTVATAICTAVVIQTVCTIAQIIIRIRIVVVEIAASRKGVLDLGGVCLNEEFLV